MNYDSTFSLNCSFNTLLDTFCNFTPVSEQYCWVCAQRGDTVLKGFWKEINTDENSSDCSYSICGMSPWPLSGDLKIAFCAFTGQGTKEKKKNPKMKILKCSRFCCMRHYYLVKSWGWAGIGKAKRSRTQIRFFLFIPLAVSFFLF